MAAAFINPPRFPADMDAARLRRHVEDICSVSTFIDPSEWDVDRLKGKLEDYLAYSRRRLDVVVSKFEELGYSAELQDFTFYGRTATNAVFRRRGVRKGRKGLWLAAHHDYCAGLGAEDDASGLAVMLELARQFRDSPAAEHLVFASFDLEEHNLKGSREYASGLSDADLGGIQHLIALECLGSGKNLTICTSVANATSDAGLVEQLRDSASSLGIEAVAADYDYFSSDHASFVNYGVRVAELASINFTRYSRSLPRGDFIEKLKSGAFSNAHMPHDLPERLDYGQLADAGRLLARFIRREYCR